MIPNTVNIVHSSKRVRYILLPTCTNTKGDNKIMKLNELSHHYTPFIGTQYTYTVYEIIDYTE